jgi:crotonobetainyl-CoA:carnitine CoA-transferase CaiB-like acyl-CoA transferase
MSAGSGASAVLADHGADVIKVEAVEGDPWRKVHRGLAQTNTRSSRLFEDDNRGKRSIPLDLLLPAGRRAFRALLNTADVLVCDVRMANTQRLGLDYESLKKQYVH